jgi:hypothetical protein
MTTAAQPPGSPRLAPVAALGGGAIALCAIAAFVLSSRSQPMPETTPGMEDEPAPAPETAPAAAAPPAAAAAAPAPAPAESRQPQQALARSLAARLAALFAPGRTLSDDDRREIEALESQLLGLGDAGVAAVVARLDGGKDAPGGRELMFNLLRRMPGEAVERRLVTEARRGEHAAMRTMAIESLAGRPTEGALAALGDIARNDPDLPARPLIAAPRSPSDTSTELPDETVFSPRMQAMSALASTRDPRAVAVLADVVKSGPDESLRMEAARNLEAMRSDPRAVEVLRGAAASDPSAYVRLAALHSLQGAGDPALAPVLETIAAGDRDAGVRMLARKLLAELRR